MPVVVDPETDIVTALLGALPSGGHGVESMDRLQAWLEAHVEEYVVVIGPGVPLEQAIGVTEGLRTSRPTTSVVLVREGLDTTTLASAMKAGARDVVQHDDPESLAAAVARAHQLWVALRGSAEVQHEGRVITVFSPKGGVGKTTMAVNLGLALADRGARRVCLVDLDLAFGDVAITMQLFPTHSIEHAIGSEDSLDEQMLQGLLTRHEASMMVLAAPAHPDARDRISPKLVTRVLRMLKQDFDYVVVDTAPAFDEQTLTALDETDECVLVATLDVPTLKNVKVALETMDMLGLAQGHRHLLLNRADDAVGIGPDKVEAILGMSVAAQVASSMDIAAATNAGSPIVVGQPDHPSSRTIRELAASFSGQPAAPGAGPAVPAAAPDDEHDKAGRRFRLRR